MLRLTAIRVLILLFLTLATACKQDESVPGKDKSALPTKTAEGSSGNVADPAKMDKKTVVAELTAPAAAGAVDPGESGQKGKPGPVSVAPLSGSGSSDREGNKPDSALPAKPASGEGEPLKPARVAASDGTPDESVVPPSTGKELLPEAPAAMTAEQAATSVRQALEEMKKPNPDHEMVAQALLAALPIAAPKPSAESLPAYQALQEAARQSKRYGTLIMVTQMLLPLGPEAADPVSLVRGLIELGEYEKALQAFRKLGEDFPSVRGDLLSVRALLFCKQTQWKQCEEAAGVTLEYNAKHGDKDLTGRASLRVRMLSAIARIHQGRLDEAEAEFKALKLLGGRQPPVVRSLKKRIEQARATGLIVEPVVQDYLALGTYHLLGKPSAGALVELDLYNFRDDARTFRVEAEVTGVTEKLVRTTTLLSGPTQEKLFFTPPMKVNLDTRSIRAQKPVQLSVRVVEIGPEAAEKVMYENSGTLQLLPADHLPLVRRIGPENHKPTPEFVAAWVTPNASAVDAFLKEAKERHPQKQFVGEQSETLTQVRALFDELKGRGVTYVMDPRVNSDKAHVQRTRRPSEVLESTNAQCLEGSILFATLLEAIGLKPLIVIVPGHAFVGWRLTSYDGDDSRPPHLFVETTMVGVASFDQAVAQGMARYVQEVQAGHFDTGVSRLLDLEALRAAGYTPQPGE